MSHNSLNYNFGFSNFKEYKDLNFPSQSNIHNNLFNRNNKISLDYPNPFTNKTTNNFSLNLNQKQLSNNMDNTPVYNTYYSNFQTQNNHIPYKINSMNYKQSSKYDKRNFTEIYYSFLNMKQPIFFLLNYYPINEDKIIRVKFNTLKIIIFCYEVMIYFIK